MAAEAVLKITKAEEKGSEMIRSANEQAKEIIRKAEADAVSKKKSIIEEASLKRAEIIDAAVKKAGESCAGLIEQGLADKERILNPGAEALESAARLVIERIVNVNGDS